MKGDVSIRDDTGRINTSPVTGNRPIVRIRYDQPSKFIIPGELTGNILSFDVKQFIQYNIIIIRIYWVFFNWFVNVCLT